MDARPLPTAAILDSQSVKTSCNVSESDQGIDANKKIEGRKRHIATDVLGVLLAVIVTAASISDSTAGRRLLDHLAVTQPDVPIAWADGGYNDEVVRHGARRAIRVEVVKRIAAQGEVSGLLHGPRLCGVGGDAGDVRAPGAVFKERQCVQTSTEHGVDVEEIRRDDALGLGGEELAPGRAAAAWYRVCRWASGTSACGVVPLTG